MGSRPPLRDSDLLFETSWVFATPCVCSRPLVRDRLWCSRVRDLPCSRPPLPPLPRPPWVFETPCVCSRPPVRDPLQLLISTRNPRLLSETSLARLLRDLFGEVSVRELFGYVSKPANPDQHTESKAVVRGLFWPGISPRPLWVSFKTCKS